MTVRRGADRAADGRSVGGFFGLLCAGLLTLFPPPVAAQAPGDDGAAPSQPAASRLAGHGGPVKGLAAYRSVGGGVQIATASFDNALGLWSGADGARLLWLDGHEAAVNAVAFTPDGASALSASDDFTARYWRLQSGVGVVMAGHKGKVADVAVSPDGRLAATASWDGTVGLWALPPLAEPAASNHAPALLGFLEGHTGAVNTVAFAPDGETLFSGSADGSVRRWRVADQIELRAEARHGFGVNAMRVGPLDTEGRETWLAYGAADGVVRVIDLADGREVAALTGDRRPILALTASPDGTHLAYGDGQGYITTVVIASWTIERDFRAAARGPIWALAYLDDDHLLAAGLDASVAIWPLQAETPPAPIGAGGEPLFLIDPLTVSNGERQFARKCSICHNLSPGSGRRAGPTLYGLFGRAIATVPDYSYSPSLKKLDIVWGDDTIDRLFDIGPDHYTPGSKMPMQRITDPQDRSDLIAYLKRATAPAAASESD